MEFKDGQMRVNAKERNNRRSESAKGMMSKAPVKSGAKRGFGSNRTKGGGINRALKSSSNSSLGS